VPSSAGRIGPSWSVPGWAHYSGVTQECLEAPAPCHRTTLPGCAPGKGCCIPPARGPAKPRLCTGTVPCHHPCHAWTPAELRSSLPASLLGLLPCLGVFEPADDSDLRSRDMFTQPGREREQHAAAVRCPVCPRHAAGPAAAPALVPGTARDGCCFGSGSSLDPRRAGTSPWGGTCPGSCGWQGQTRVCCSQAGRFRVLHPLPAGSAQQLLFSLINPDVCSPSLFASCARGTSIAPSRRRLAQLAAGTCPLARLAGGLMPSGFLGNQATSWPAWNSSSASTVQKPPGLRSKPLLSCLSLGIR